MKRDHRLRVSWWPLALALAAAPVFGQGSSPVLVADLQSPIKLILTPAGNLLVSEAGLPSSFVPTLYIAIGQGDVVTRPVPPVPGVEVPNPDGIVSALFSSLLRVRFSKPIDRVAGDFLLDPAVDHPTLVDGLPVTLLNAQGQRAVGQVIRHSNWLRTNALAEQARFLER